MSVSASGALGDPRRNLSLAYPSTAAAERERWGSSPYFVMPKVTLKLLTLTSIVLSHSANTEFTVSHPSSTFLFLLFFFSFFLDI